ncbi:PAS domain S-box protein, partial [Candidatus Sumerlaeota bacterium]|nr:PAS domain S-box protein [Candidatus Sumerlaeota bacterium]
MNTRLRILCLEDEPDDVELVRHALVSGGIEADLEVVADGESFLGALESVQCDLILSDYALPHYDGLKALEAAQRRRPDIPFIFVSGRLGEEAAIEALKHGATDYVLKNSLMRLPSVVRRALEEVRQRRARELAEKAHARMALILDQTVDFVVMADPQQRVFYLNQAGRRMLGFAERDDPSDHRLVEFYPAWAVELFLKEALPAAIRQGVWTGESALLGRNGGEIPVLQVLLTHKDTAGNLEFLSTIARDITDRKRAEGELRESERKFKSVFSSSLDAILIFDAHSGEILAANPACKRIFGYEGEELVGKSFSILVPRESNISPESMFEKIRSYGAVFEDQDFLRANGSPCPMDITAGLIPWKTGHAILACFRDVSE